MINVAANKLPEVIPGKKILVTHSAHISAREIVKVVEFGLKGIILKTLQLVRR